MRTGPVAKGPRLWLQRERSRKGRVEPAVWVIRDDGAFKRSTGFAVADRGAAEQALARYIAERHAPPKRRSDPSETLTVDVLNLFGRDVVPSYARPKETASRLKRLGLWWGQPAAARATFLKLGRPAEAVDGHVSDVRTATCQAYLEHVGHARSGRMDLELLRAAINHAFAEGVLDRPVPVWLPEKSLPRERWLTRDEVAKLVWAAWRARRQQKSGPDDTGTRQHLARFILMAHYTGTRSGAILNACFERKMGRGFIDLEAGLWYRRGAGVRATKKRQPPVPLPQPLLAHMRRWRANGQIFAVEYQGNPIERVARAMRRLIADCGFDRDVVVHTLRHTAITWAMQRGMDTWDASGYFGLNLQTLVDVYGHHHPDHLRDAAAIMARPARQPRAFVTDVRGTLMRR